LGELSGIREGLTYELGIETVVADRGHGSDYRIELRKFLIERELISRESDRRAREKNRGDGESKGKREQRRVITSLLIKVELC